MPRNTEGGYSLPSGTLVNSGDTILVSQHNPAMTDIATAIGNSLDRNGSGGMRAALNMGGNPIQNVGNGTNPTDVATVAQASAGGVPVGVEMFYAGSVAPPDYMFEFGQAISRTAYADLFAAIGTTYGPGDGTTTFNLPDCRGVALVGKDDMGGTASGRLSNFLSTTLGAIFGSQSHTLASSEMPVHSHAATTDEQGSHSHTIQGRAGSDTSGIYVGGASIVDNIKNTNVAGAHTHNITVNNAGGGAAHNNVQPSSVRNVIIKVK